MLLMSAFVSKLLVRTSGIMLILSPGWCCATPSPKATDIPAQPTHSCCQHKQPTPSQVPVPTQPVERCCCDKDLAGPPNPVSTSPDLTLSLAVVVPDAPAALAAGVSDLDFTGPFPSSSLHVLQCVWRC
jgi:hypothetical protein